MYVVVAGEDLWTVVLSSEVSLSGARTNLVSRSGSPERTPVGTTMFCLTRGPFPESRSTQSTPRRTHWTNLLRQRTNRCR